jgi:hypothetical protein
MKKGRAKLPWKVVAGQKAFFITLGGPQAHDHSGRDDKLAWKLRRISSLNRGLWFWTGAPCSPKRTPDFLSSLLALANFMRLSLMKAAHAAVGGAPCRKSGYMGRKRIFQMLSLHARGFLLLAVVFFARVAEALEGAAPVCFGPCTLERTWGTRPGKRALLFAQGQGSRKSLG